MTPEKLLEIYKAAYKEADDPAYMNKLPVPNMVQHAGNVIGNAVDRFRPLFTGDKAKADALRVQYRKKQELINEARQKAATYPPSIFQASRFKADVAREARNNVRRAYAAPLSDTNLQDALRNAVKRPHDYVRPPVDAAAMRKALQGRKLP